MDIEIDIQELTPAEKENWKQILLDYRSIVERKISFLRTVANRQSGITTETKKPSRFHNYCRKLKEQHDR